MALKAISLYIVFLAKFDPILFWIKIHGRLQMQNCKSLKYINLQEFGGIPVTGVIDHATKELMRRKRCGRPDREPGNDENGKRKKRFAVQGEKWKYTNLTWR